VLLRDGAQPPEDAVCRPPHRDASSATQEQGNAFERLFDIGDRTLDGAELLVQRSTLSSRHDVPSDRASI
jgi:hypothetical protein